VSDSDDPEEQVRDAASFLESQAFELDSLKENYRADASLDFGTFIREEHLAVYRSLPPQLATLAARYEITLVISVYKASDPDDP
jgi:hypothetical protein